MFRIEDGRSSFWQWDLNQRLVVGENLCNEIHFSNKLNGSAMVCRVYKDETISVVDVPNILLQDSENVHVYAYVTDGNQKYTKRETWFTVNPRPKPADYVYTETELYTVEEMLEVALQAAKESGDFKGEKGDPAELSIATPETLGGVQPVAKTEDMTQSVGVDEIGGLWTLPGGGGSGGGDNAWKLIGRTTTEEEVTDVIITSETVMSELLVYYSVPPIAEDTGGNTYAMPVIINASGAVDYINTNIDIPKPSTKTHRRIWHIMPLGTIRQLWEAGTASPPSEVLGITEDANVMIRNAYENGGGLIGFRLRWNVNGVLPVGTYLEVWGR